MLNLHVAIWGNERGLTKIVLKPNPTFTFQEHGNVFPETLPCIEAYLNKKTAKLPPLDFKGLPLFTIEVLYALKHVPWGKTLSYAALASKIGRPRAARPVGTALASNPFPLLLPCHRIIASSGKLGGYGPGPEMKQQLLTHEAS